MDDDGMLLEQELGGLERMRDLLRQIAGGARDAARAGREASRNLGGIGAGAPAPGAPGGYQPPRQSYGPYQRLDYYQRQMALFNAQGGPGAVGSDLSYFLQRAQARVDALNRPTPTFWQQAGQAVLSSRLSLGSGGLSGVQPLVGRLMGPALTALGGGAGLAGPLGLVVAGLMAFNTALRASGQALDRYTQSVFSAGGNQMATGQLMAGGASAGDARALLDRIQNSPWAMAEAGRQGISVVPGPYGTLDASSVLMRHLQAMRRLPEQERMRVMRIMGTEHLSRMTHVSDRTFGALELDAQAARATRGSHGATIAGAEMATSATRLQNAFENLLGSLSPFTRMLATVTGYLADLINEVARFIAWLGKPLHWMLDATEEVHKNKGGMFQYESEGRGKRQAQIGEALDQNTRSLMDNTVAMGYLTREMRALGGGERARSGYGMPPAMMRGDNTLRALEWGAIPEGAL